MITDYRDVDMYGQPYQDHDPLLGLVVTVVLIAIWYLAAWIWDCGKR